MQVFTVIIRSCVCPRAHSSVSSSEQSPDSFSLPSSLSQSAIVPYRIFWIICMQVVVGPCDAVVIGNQQNKKAYTVLHDNKASTKLYYSGNLHLSKRGNFSLEPFPQIDQINQMLYHRVHHYMYIVYTLQPGNRWYIHQRTAVSCLS